MGLSDVTFLSDSTEVGVVGRGWSHRRKMDKIYNKKVCLEETSFSGLRCFKLLTTLFASGSGEGQTLRTRRLRVEFKKEEVFRKEQWVRTHELEVVITTTVRIPRQALGRLRTYTRIRQRGRSSTRETPTTS